ncbi:hypothetical protein AQ862_32910 [Burkholderia pseudomallei]|nr:hypothetical protein AQ862_32910 [Burkholderia pseudomallei]
MTGARRAYRDVASGVHGAARRGTRRARNAAPRGEASDSRFDVPTNIGGTRAVRHRRSTVRGHAAFERHGRNRAGALLRGARMRRGMPCIAFFGAVALASASRSARAASCASPYAVMHARAARRAPRLERLFD